ncbi:MAG TPA: menaquinol oxidoreductase [Desulfosporosinus sp.]|jgi:hypothetical protein|nr:menaquinol oxidoreductase [Desulfosporosinus sp.]
MYKGGKIIASLIIFVAFLTLPFLVNMGKANAGPENLKASISQLQQAGKQCVEPADYMRANHMQLLVKWRNSDVREGNTVYINSQGKSFDISLQSCLECHATTATKVTTNPVGVSNPALDTSSDQFCVSCHNYASVKPTCWSCHSGPEGATK